MTPPSHLLTLSVLLALGASGCATAPQERAGLTAGTPDPSALVAPEEMEEPSPGVVEIDGDDDPFTTASRQGFRADPDGRDVRTTQATSGADDAFRRLCRGEVDVVASSRPISADEAATCRANGLGAVAFRVATLATVVAVAGDADVVDECLDDEQVDLAVAGTDDEATLTLVAGRTADRERALALPQLETDRKDASADVKAQRTWFGTAQDELTAALAERRRGIAEGRPPAQRAADAARVRRAQAELTRARTAFEASRTELGRIEPLLDAARRSATALDAARGTVGRFSAGFAESAGALLRPLAVANDTGCVLPTNEAFTSGAYPLADPLFTTVTTRSLARSDVEEYVRFQLDDGEALADQSGAVPLSDEDRTDQLGWLDGDPPPAGGSSEPERPAQ